MARENDKVTLVKRGYEGLVGVIDTVYEQGLYIVRLFDKTLVKCLEDDFVVMEKEEDSTPDRENQITISRKDFLEISSEVIAGLSDKQKDPHFSIALGLTGVLVVNNIAKRLFND